MVTNFLFMTKFVLDYFMFSHTNFLDFDLFKVMFEIISPFGIKFTRELI